MDGFTHLLKALGVFFGALAAILIGTEAGTADQSSGVFRDLVATGRSRLPLFSVRLPAAIIVTLAFTAAAYGLGLLADLPVRGLESDAQPWPCLAGCGLVAAWELDRRRLAVGVGSLTGSRAITLTAVIGFETISPS